MINDKKSIKMKKKNRFQPKKGIYAEKIEKKKLGEKIHKFFLFLIIFQTITQSADIT